ncbi:SAM-dependent methyltransferase, MidA family [Cognatiyoonia sediminum]|uniref:SAM-dependent methyltransferase, MidA family n=1 Tax=Cognatiyoonia sediminum TaxID=1508389 RepID=A0A1M5SFD7_9RHOB|nr:SAM-dependent methyltransferase [Cognatiyoonia sediminum]SHH37150.1 SAM-dependent methyltransferase, MidA family [Cognatiyoonia sediminum]
MTALADELKARIARFGPVTVAEYMAECLMHPTHGYYTTRDPLGRAGDFTTAPEISQMFGEMVGLCLAQVWMDQGQPSPFTLAELGPGRGTLMADILRAARGVPGFTEAAEVHLVEVSPTLRAAQSVTVGGAMFHDSVESLPDQPLFLVANEFFDALPIRQFIRAEGGWSERMIGLEDEELVFGLSAAAPIAMLDEKLESTAVGDMIETCGALPGIAHVVGDLIARNGGAALIIDYGGWDARGDTFQAVKYHQKVDPLAEPGQADLTAHVDFAAIAAAVPSAVTEMTDQGVFLERLGITQRAQRLAQSLSGDALKEHIAAHRRLTHPDEMGHLFKVIGLYPNGAPPPAGLTP